MSTANAPPRVSLVCQNVQGLTSIKLLDMLSWLREKHVDIAVLTETQVATDPAAMLLRQPGAGAIWPRAQFFHCPGSGHTGGVCIILGPSCQLAAPTHAIEVAGGGRVLRLDITLRDVRLSIVGVYAPAHPGDRPQFFRDVVPAFLPDAGSPLLLVGDFNCVTSATDCVYPPGVAAPAVNTRLIGAAELSDIMTTHQLQDVWRDGASNQRAFTHWSAAAHSGARLDRWLCSSSLLHRFTAASSIEPASSILSDHLPVSLRLTARAGYVPHGKGLQGFPLLMLNMPAAVNELSAFLFVRTQELLATPDDELLHRYDNLKADALREAWRIFSYHQERRLQGARAADTAAAAAMRRLLRTNAAADFAGHVQQLQEAATAATVAWQHMASRPRQVVATLDHMFGDCSSYYFHHQARAPHPHAVIHTLHRPGRGPADPVEAADLTTHVGISVGLQYAASFYSSASPFGLFRPRVGVDSAAQDALLATLPHRLSPVDALLAEGVDGNGLLSAEDLDVALQMAARGSSPGHDGLPYEFYRAFRHVMLPVLLRVFNAAFLERAADQPLARLLRGVICLILKPDQPPTELASYRPITLLNCDAKLVMLVMSNRLQRPLDYVIDITQSAFLRGRDISDNIRYHMGLAARLQELGLPGWLLHSDLTKAYDTADRGWLSRCMTAMGFQDCGIVRWCRILMGGSTSVVRVNGFLTAPFPATNGLAQGSALSCTEWVLLLQPAVAYLNRLQSSGRLAGFTLPSGAPAPATLAFADDTKSYVQDPAVDGVVLQDAFQLFARAGLPIQSIPKTRLIHLSGPVPAPLQPSEAVTHHATTGYRLQPLDQPHRLLGVPFGASPAACTRASFASMPGAMTAAAAAWLPRQINMLGRSHVAMQCIASKFVYQANFAAPAPTHLPAMQTAINRFVSTSSRIEEASPAPGKLFPRFAISVLPHDKGGLGLPDLAAFSTALLAKPGWLLFRYTSHPWQTLVRHEVTSAFAPTEGRPLGFYRLVTDPGAALLPSVASPLVHSMITAFSKLNISRIAPPSSQSFESIMLELTFNNVVPDHSPVCTEEVSELARQWHRLRDVRAVYLGALGSQPLATPEQTALDLILARIPDCWRSAVLAPNPSGCAWRVVSPPGATVVVLSGPHPETTASTLWELWPSGRLHPLPAGTLCPSGPGRPALVELRAKPKTAWSRHEFNFAASQLQLLPALRREVEEPWLVGVWGDMQLDPQVWGICLDAYTRVTLLQLKVRHARRLAAHHNVIARLAHDSGRVRGYAEHGAAWPASWAVHAPDPDPAEVPVAPTADLPLLGIAGLEEHWRRAAAAAAELPVDDPLSVDRVPRWLDLSQAPSPRPSPADRASAREQEPADPVLRQDYQAVWTRLRDPTLHRPFRITCWRLLHGVVGCRAFLAHVRRRQHLLGDATICCQAPGCVAANTPETLTHAFLLCPEVSPVIDWLLATWAHLTQQPPPPRLASVLLADDLAGWPLAPQDPGTLKMWTRLRVTTIGAIWQTRCARAEGRAAEGSFARRVVSLAVAHLVAAIRRDWLRTQADLRHLDDGAFCVDWWRGFDISLTEAQFVRQWATPPLFCKVVDGAPADGGGPAVRALELCLGVDTPVPWPDPPMQPPQPAIPALPDPPPDPSPPSLPPPSPSPPSSPQSSSDSQPTCPICRRHFSAVRPAMWTPCKHSFHFRCIQQWRARNETCPMCRAPI